MTVPDVLMVPDAVTYEPCMGMRWLFWLCCDCGTKATSGSTLSDLSLMCCDDGMEVADAVSVPSELAVKVVVAVVVVVSVEVVAAVVVVGLVMDVVASFVIFV